MDKRLGLAFQQNPSLRKTYMRDQVKEMNSYLTYVRQCGDNRDKNVILVEWVENGSSADFSIRWMRIHGIY